MKSIALDDLNLRGSNAPENCMEDLRFLDTSFHGRAAQFSKKYDNLARLDALLIGANSDCLVVVLHGAIDRKKVALPRYERLATIKSLGVNAMFFGDPGLWLHKDVRLTWFTGNKAMPVQQDIADVVEEAADRLKCSSIIFVGDSGGGFAALQISALVNSSICLAFNPTTTLHNYFDGGNRKHTTVQKTYLSVMYPEVLGEDGSSFDLRLDWGARIGDSVSALRRYAKPRKNFVILVQNNRDWHYEQHYFPLLAAAALGNNLARFQVLEYQGEAGHYSPSWALFTSGLSAAFHMEETIRTGRYWRDLKEGRSVLR